MSNGEHLVHRRQFFAGKKRANVPSGWTVSCVNNFFVHTHPDLNLSRASCRDGSVLLLGDVFDPNNITANNQNITQNLADNLSGFEDFELLSKRLNGRWVCIISIGEQLRVYPDALITHPIYYTGSVASDDDVWLGTQPGLLAEYCGIRKDNEFILKHDKYSWIGWWPGELAPYQCVKKLLANHYLDLNRNVAKRYWPKTNIAPIPLTEAATKIADILGKTIKAISHRSPLFISLTGGWDSRMLFACSDSEDPRIKFLNRRFPLMAHHDISIPEKLVKRANSTLKILRLNDEDLVNPEILELYKRNTGYMTWHELSLIHSSNRHVDDSHFVLQGHGGECFRFVIGGAEFERLHNKGKLTLAHYAMFAGSEENQLIIDELSRWFDHDWPTDVDIYPPSLIENECLFGSWSSLICTANNMFGPSITPFNSGEIIETGFGVDIKHRMSPSYDLAREICRAAKPWVLELPVNASWRTAIRNSVIKAGSVLPWRLQQKIIAGLKYLVWTRTRLKKHYEVMKDYPPTISEFMSKIP